METEKDGNWAFWYWYPKSEMDPLDTRFIQKVCIQVFSWMQDHTTICP